MATRTRLALREWWARRHLIVVIWTFILLFLVILLSPWIFFTVPSGHAGVLFMRFFGGTVTDSVRDEGFQVIAPWDSLTIYDVRVQQIEHSFPLISSNGLTVQVTMSIRYHPKVELLGLLHKDVGPKYVDSIVVPEVQALVRETFGHYSPEEMYTTKRSLIEQTLQGALGKVSEKYVVLDDLLIKTILLPSLLQAAIERKLVEEQRVLEMRFKLDWERLEAERAVIEAVGVNASQGIIGETLTDQLLMYKGIAATLKLAESQNAKVVIAGGRNGLPLILDAGFGTSNFEGITNTGLMFGMTNSLQAGSNRVQQLTLGTNQVGAPTNTAPAR